MNVKGNSSELVFVEFLFYANFLGIVQFSRFQGLVIQNLAVVSVSFQGLGHSRPGIPLDRAG